MTSCKSCASLPAMHTQCVVASSDTFESAANNTCVRPSCDSNTCCFGLLYPNMMSLVICSEQHLCAPSVRYKHMLFWLDIPEHDVFGNLQRAALVCTQRAILTETFVEYVHRFAWQLAASNTCICVCPARDTQTCTDVLAFCSEQHLCAHRAIAKHM